MQEPLERRGPMPCQRSTLRDQGEDDFGPRGANPWKKEYPMSTLPGSRKWTGDRVYANDNSRANTWRKAAHTAVETLFSAQHHPHASELDRYRYPCRHVAAMRMPAVYATSSILTREHPNRGSFERSESYANGVALCNFTVTSIHVRGVKLRRTEQHFVEWHVAVCHIVFDDDQSTFDVLFVRELPKALESWRLQPDVRRRPLHVRAMAPLFEINANGGFTLCNHFGQSVMAVL